MDWSALAPHRSLDVGDPRYAERPTEGGATIAGLVRAGRSVVLVAGPAGIGKSTEVAQTAHLLKPDRLVAWLPIDRLESVRSLTPDQLKRRTAGAVGAAAQSSGHELSDRIRQELVNQGVLGGARVPGPGKLSADALLKATLEEVSRGVGKRIVVVIDGLEKTVPGSHELFHALAGLPDETDVVVVVPWHAAYGPDAAEVVRPGEKLLVLHPIEMGSGTGPGAQFLGNVLIGKGQGLPFFLLTAAILAEAARWSGGVPRTLLQLIADAGTAAATRGAQMPTVDDMQTAIVEQRDSLRRLLLPGDAEAMRAADGTDAREVALDRKLRLLTHGILLERLGPDGPVMRVHPLARELVGLPPDA